MFSKKSDRWGWRQEREDFLRATAAGIIFGIPLLFTMEMWWHGVTFHPKHLLLALVATIVVNFVLSIFLGFRRGHSITEAVDESITAVAIAVVIATAVLVLIGEISSQTTLDDALGKIIMQAVIISVGISVTNAKFKPDQKGERGGDDQSEEIRALSSDNEQRQLMQDLKDAGATIVGALIFSFNIAPTEEVVKIASKLSSWQLLALLGAELMFCYLILFASGFWRRPVFTKDSLFQSPFAETLLATFVALLIAGALVMLVGHAQSGLSLASFVASTVVLGCPAVVGGAAGRLVI